MIVKTFVVCTKEPCLIQSLVRLNYLRRYEIAGKKYCKECGGLFNLPSILGLLYYNGQLPQASDKDNYSGNNKLCILAYFVNGEE